MKFVPYNQFKNIKKIGKGGFSKIYKATWNTGPSYWNEEKGDFEYKDSIIVALKQLNNSKILLLNLIINFILIIILNI